MNEELYITCKNCGVMFNYYDGTCTKFYCLQCYFEKYPQCRYCEELGNKLCMFHCKKKDYEDWIRTSERCYKYEQDD